MKEESGEGNLGFAGCWGIDPYGFLIFYLRGFAHGEVGIWDVAMSTTG